MDLKRVYIKILQSGRWLLLLFIASLMIISCRSKGDEPPVLNLDDFLAKNECGLYGYGGYLLRYNEEKFQISINEKRRQIRVQSDDQKAYFNVVFAMMPSSIDEVVSIDFSYKGGGDELSYKMEMVLYKATSQNMWLWNQDEKLGIILPRF